MRQREYICRNRECPNFQEAPSMTADSEFNCYTCGRPMELVAYPLKTVFTGVITARYNNPQAENAHQDGHYAWRRKSSTLPGGKPQPVFIENFDQQREFCKAEGLANPKDMPTNFEVSSDGRTVLNTRGMPGTEI